MLKKTIFIFIFVFTILEISAQSAICGYTYRKRISFDPTKVIGSSDLTDFPALINITSDNDLRTSANSGHVQNSNGYDIVFTAADGVTLLSFELERYTSTTGQLTAWVKIPTLSTTYSTHIYMYYGNSSISTNQSTTSVWSNYWAVWHLQNGSFLDATGNGYTATNFSTTNQSSAFINDGRALNGTQWLELSNFPNMTSDFSISAWGYTTDNTLPGRIFADDANNTGGYGFSIADGGTGSVRFFSRGSNPVILETAFNLISNNTWYHLVGVANVSASTKSIYINGSSAVSGAYSGSWSTDSGNSTIGGEVSTGETYTDLRGRLDEVRIAKSALSANWIATEYNNQNSPSTFYSISAEPNVFTGNSSVFWNTSGNWSFGSTPTASTDIILSPSTNQPSLNVNIQLSSVWIRPSTTLTIGGSRLLRILYDVTNCGQIEGVNASSGLELNSTSQIQVQNLSGSGVYNLQDLTINNTFTASPSVVLGASVNVAADLVLTSGIVSTSSTNILTLGSSATSGSGSATSHISGPMSKIGNTAFVFPVGKGGNWRRLQISAPSSSSTFRAEYFNTTYSNTASLSSPLTDVSRNEYWQLDRLSGTGDASVSLYWESANASGIDNCADLTVARWNGSSWVELAASTSTGSSCSGSGTGIITTTAQVTSFSPFTFGSKSSTLNPLPVELVDFEAVCESDLIKFQWSTTSEHNNDYFSVEFSENGSDWTELKRVKGAGNSSTSNGYSFLTESIPGYFRLVQVDLDKTRNIFKVLYPDCRNQKETSYAIYPNPAISEVLLRFELKKLYQDFSIQIYDQWGRMVLSKAAHLNTGSNIVRLPLHLVSGVYLVKVSSEDLQLPAQKLVVE